MVDERTQGGDDRLSLRNNRPKFRPLGTQPVIMEVCFRRVRTIAKTQLLALLSLSVCLSVRPTVLMEHLG
jgi:hypothetical protein